MLLSSICAIVTGHTRGIGAALTKQLLERGIAVLGLSRHCYPDLPKRFRRRFIEIRIDLSNLLDVETWITSDRLRSFIDSASCVLLFNNAGTIEPIGPLGSQDTRFIRYSVCLNVATPLMLSSALANSLPDGSECRIAHLSSGAARHPYSGWSIYCATKASLDHHARVVAMEENNAFRICSIAPGIVDTDMQATIRASSINQFPSLERFKKLKKSGKLSMPENVAQKLIDYIFSDEFGKTPVVDIRELPDFYSLY
ncbi:MAG: SDR family oxidoreductase [Burkholderia sp.]|nr:SDR family oxidoreductase [Burkholderia sp.]